MKTFLPRASTHYSTTFALATFLLAACGGGNVDSTASNVSVAVPKSSMIAASGMSSKAASKASSAASMAASSNPAGSTVSNAGRTSHNPGENCMDCHLTGGTGTAVVGKPFTLAGTVSGGAGVTVQLILHNQNQISATLITDKTGNFYTTVPVVGVSTDGSLVNGVDAYSGNNKMGGVVGSGACNSCHSAGGGVARIN